MLKYFFFSATKKDLILKSVPIPLMKVKGLFYKTYFGSNLLVHRTLLLTILTILTMTLLIMTLQIMTILEPLKMGEITCNDITCN
jgi:hypothetical protein